MPTPLDNIKKGIISNDMSMVMRGYKALTGEDLSAKVLKEKPKKAPTKPRKPARAVKVKEPETELELEDLEEAPAMSRKANLQSVRLSKQNKFKDNRKDAAEDRKIDKLIGHGKRSKRPAPKEVTVNCDECGQECRFLETELVPGSSATCNKCLRSKFYGGR